VGHVKKGLFLFLYGFAALASSMAAESAGFRIQVSTASAQIFLTPSPDGKVISHPPIGAILEAEQKTGEWYQVSFQDQSGFIVRGYIHESMARVLDEPVKSPAVQPAPPVPRRPPGTIPPPRVQVPPRPPISEQSGFWLRVNIGYSPLAVMKSEDDDEVTGGAAAVVLSLGKFLNEQLVVYGELIGDVITGPDFKSRGMTYSGDEELSASLTGIGVGIGYYLIPNSVFAGMSLSMATLSIEHQGLGWEGATNPGIGVAFQIGKDFQISRKVMLGVAGHGFLATMKDRDGGPQWTSTALGITAAITWVPRGLAGGARRY